MATWPHAGTRLSRGGNVPLTTSSASISIVESAIVDRRIRSGRCLVEACETALSAVVDRRIRSPLLLIVAFASKQ